MAAEQDYGDGLAALDLGDAYRKGNSVSADFKKALFWYRKAAALMNPIAYCYIGDLYLQGTALERDYGKAFDCFFKGSEGYVNCLCKLGDMYLRGLFTEQDAAFAATLYEQCLASEWIEYCDCYASACLRMGECCLNGWGTERDIDAAIEYLNKIGDCDDPHGFDGDVIFQSRLTRLRKGIEHAKYYEGEAAPLPPADESSRRGRSPEESDWLRAAQAVLEDRADAKTWVLLADCYRRGVFVSEDKPFAAECERKARAAMRKSRKKHE
jgi:TPR repeat protein